MSDEKKDLPAAPPEPAPQPVVGIVFTCGSGIPCKITRIYQNPPQPPELKALPEKKKP